MPGIIYNPAHSARAMWLDCRRRRARRPWPRSSSTGAAPQPAAPACPARPTPAISSQTPADVCIPDGFTGIARGLLRRLLVAGLRRARVAGGARTSRRGRVGKSIAGRRSARLRDLQGDCGRSFTATDRRRNAAFDKYDAAQYNPCGGVGDVRRRDHRIGLGDRRHRAGGHRRPRSADRRAERTIRSHPDALQSDRLRSHRQEPLLPAERAAAGAQAAAGPAGDRIPDGIDRRQNRVDRRDRSAGGRW